LDRFLALLRKHYGSFKYLWVKEVHQDGNPHVHLLMSCDLPACEPALSLVVQKGNETTTFVDALNQQVVSRYAMSCGFGYNVRWERLRKDGKYVAKYLQKQEKNDPSLNALIAMNKLRDWSCSKGLKPPRTELEYWFYERGKEEMVDAHFQATAEEAREALDKKREEIKEKEIERVRRHEARAVLKMRSKGGA
jgi:hypothetical protein